MTEFDFDELDRSISAAMAKNNAKKANDSAGQSAPGVSRSMTPERRSAPEISRPAGASESTVKPIVGSHRRGQFMDMVHPSSNMTARRSQIVSRKSHTMQPITPPSERDAAQEPPLSLSANTETNDSRVETHSAGRPAVDAFQFDKESTGAANGTSFVEPKNSDIAEHDFRSNMNSQTINNDSPLPPASSVDAPLADMADTAAHDDRQASAASELHEPAYTEPEIQASPFLPNAKPAKRPLDAWQHEQEPSMQQMNDLSAALQADLEVSQPGETLTANAIPAASRDNIPADDEDGMLGAEPVANTEPKTSAPTSAPASRRLSDVDRLSALDRETPAPVERNTSAIAEPETTDFFDPTKHENTTTENSRPPMPASELLERDTPHIEAVKADPEPTLDMSATIEEVAALESEQKAVNSTTSIPQQYVERDIVPEPNAAIYDTEQYHIDVDDDAPAIKQAPASKAKKNPAVRVVWLIVLLLFGSLAGAAGYYFLMNR
ncbi:MAG: hypothetical protein ACFNNB_02425 [Candidatus Saccharimonas sp.]